jgi:hypothetical protein
VVRVASPESLVTPELLNIFTPREITQESKSSNVKMGNFHRLGKASALKTQHHPRIVKFLQQETSIFLPIRLTRLARYDCMIGSLHFPPNPPRCQPLPEG